MYTGTYTYIVFIYTFRPYLHWLTLCIIPISVLYFIPKIYNKKLYRVLIISLYIEAVRVDCMVWIQTTPKERYLMTIIVTHILYQYWFIASYRVIISGSNKEKFICNLRKQFSEKTFQSSNTNAQQLNKRTNIENKISWSVGPLE